VSSAVANASENRILPIPTPVVTPILLYKRASSVGRFYDGLRAARWPVERHKKKKPHSTQGLELRGIQTTHGTHVSDCVSVVRPFYGGLLAARWRADHRLPYIVGASAASLLNSSGV
jgi:hypothetical protein